MGVCRQIDGLRVIGNFAGCESNWVVAMLMRKNILMRSTIVDNFVNQSKLYQVSAVLSFHRPDMQSCYPPTDRYIRQRYSVAIFQHIFSYENRRCQFSDGVKPNIT